MIIDPVFHYTLTLSFSLLFMLAGLSKLQHRVEFEKVLEGYDMLPLSIVSFCALAIPVAEGLVAIGLLLTSWREAAFVSVGLFLFYAMAMAINLQRGRVDLNCGCKLGGADNETMLISKGLVLRNCVMAISAMLIFIPVTERTLGISDMALIAFCIIMLRLSYATINQLITNHYRYQEML